MSGQAMRSLSDQHDDGQVVEKLKGANDSLVGLLAMSARRLP
jgi:hypothetical protein